MNYYFMTVKFETECGQINETNITMSTKKFFNEEEFRKLFQEATPKYKVKTVVISFMMPITEEQYKEHNS